MPINKEGVELLKSDMRANPRAYEQMNFGRIATENECGTAQCMAGFCYLRKVGILYFIEKLKDDSESPGQFEISCAEAAMDQLGIVRYDPKKVRLADIFRGPFAWPSDLADAFDSSDTSSERVEVACRALDRLNEDGSIKELNEI